MVAGFQGGRTFLKPLKWYKELTTVKGRSEKGFFLVEGFRSIEQLYRINAKSIEELLVTENSRAFCKSLSCPVRILTEVQLKQISNAVTPQGIIAVVRLPQNITCAKLPEKYGERIVALENVQDPGNVGTLIRTAAALEYSGVILNSHCADPFSPKALQSTAGTFFSLWIRRSEHFLTQLELLKKDGYEIIAADLSGEKHFDFSSKRKHVIMLGNEGSGLTCGALGLSTSRLCIPIDRQKAESLNVAVCGGILMFAGKMNSGW